MKKVLTLFAIFAMVGLVSCKKDPVEATITASDVTVEEGSSVKINAATNSSATITYSSDNTAVATVAADGTVNGVAAGSANITIKVAAVADEYTAAQKVVKVTVTAKEVPEEPEGPIVIDGDFADWSELAAGTFTRSVSDPDAPWDAVKEVRCYANADFVFYYIKYDAETLEELLSNSAESLPMRLNINTDHEWTTGYASYFLEAYDFMVEGHIADNGAFCSFDGGFYQRINGSWTKPALLAEGSGMCCGAGSGCEYEIRLDRAMFNSAANTSSVPMPMGDDFETSLRFYTDGGGSWEELSNVPNSSIDEEQGNGYGYLMRIHTNK